MRSTRDTIISIKNKYKEVLGVNASQVVNKNDDAWGSFFKQLDLKKQGRLPSFIRRLSHQAIGRTGSLGRRRYTYRSEAMDII